MPICSKCQQKEATVHITQSFSGVGETREETRHFCEDCAPPTGIEGKSLEEIMAMSSIGKKCEFCGKDAVSGVNLPEGLISWCKECGMDLSRIKLDLLRKDPVWGPEFNEPRKEFKISWDFDPEKARAAGDVIRKAIQMLKDRRALDQGLK